MEFDWIECGDCLQLMKQIPDGSVDLVLTDPPYGTTASNWDKIINFNEMWDELRRLLKPTGSVLLFASGAFEPRLMLSNLDEYKYKWVWVKNKPGCFVHAKNRPMTRHESILVFSKAPMGHVSQLKDKRMTYNPQGIEDCNIVLKHNETKFGTTAGKRPSHKDETVQTKTGYPSDVLFYDKPTDNYHPTQKPVELLEFLIKSYTDDGGVVLDFTMGSGSTCVAAVNTGRHYVGFELDQDYFNIACKRLDEAEKEVV